MYGDRQAALLRIAAGHRKLCKLSAADPKQPVTEIVSRQFFKRAVLPLRRKVGI